MKYKWYILVMICLSISFLTSCQYNNAGNHQENKGVRINNAVYQPLSSDDIQKFIEDNAIEPLGVDTLYSYNTVIIYGDLYSRGYYEIYKKEGEVLNARKVDTSGDWSDSESIIFSGGTASGDYPFSILYIQDDALINNGNLIEVLGAEGSLKIDLAHQAIAFETKTIGDVLGYRVINSNNEVILEEQ